MITLQNARTRFLTRWLLAAITAAVAVACAVNPVTGEREFRIYGEDWEQQVGGQMYAPMKQSQGGEFVLDPALTQYVQDVGESLAAHAKRKDAFDFEFSVLNDSTPNAWALPGGKIVVNRGLLTELDSEAELAAVLAHEIVHADAGHGAHQQSTGMLAQVGAVASMVVLGSTIENESARQIAMQVPAVGAQLIMQRYGRDAERESDEYGMRYMAEAGYDPQGAVHLQETFVELSKERREDWLSGLFASHPPSQERVENNRKTAAELPAGGELGRERYQQKIAYLERVKPAYTAYDEAGQALSEKNLTLAQKNLDRALAIEPREALFMAMQGDILALEERPKKALPWYDRAIQANADLFYPHLRKGQLAFKLGQQERARSSLERSLELLPTAEAHYLLGRLDLDAGSRAAALEHLRAAAQSQSDAGKRAQGELVRLDLPQNAANYVPTQAAQDKDGYIWIQFGNRSPLALRDIQFSYAWVDDAGRTRQDSVTWRGPLAGGKQDRVRLNLRLPAVQNLDQRFRVQVTAAAVAE
jgi:predicted Zn-dependent protease